MMNFKSVLLSLGIFLSLGSTLMAQQELFLWPNGTPEKNGIKEKEVIGDNSIQFVENITTPKLYVFLPEKHNSQVPAVVICPGGGYAGEAMKHEGYDFAKWLNEQGIAGIVLKYRLPNGNHMIPLKDAQQAIRTVRASALKWGIDPNKIGIAGFSAGGHLASTAGTHFDTGNPSANDEIGKQSCRPDFMILFYPVITLNKEFTHMGTRDNLLGRNYEGDLEQYYSNERQVTKDTPPTFLVLSDDDKVVPTRNSIDFYSALKKQNIPVSMFIFGKGGHGWGLNKDFYAYSCWTMLLQEWFKEKGFLQ
ncbi:MAG: alpha/beta hydrolase [Bacteroidota bacterium]|nr:alpha/beta hydrolase [Bacteroidota bacterium]MDP4205591.1 alpha/beta hydrolase [Bacteroidota bacterium]